MKGLKAVLVIVGITEVKVYTVGTAIQLQELFSAGPFKTRKRAGRVDQNSG